jgi:hypothetical protein
MKGKSFFFSRLAFSISHPGDDVTDYAAIMQSKGGKIGDGLHTQIDSSSTISMALTKFKCCLHKVDTLNTTKACLI